MSAVAGSAGSLLVQVAAKLAGQSVSVQSADSFSYVGGDVRLSSPVAAALYVCSKNPELVGSSAGQQAGVLQYCMYSHSELRHLVAGWFNPTQAAVDGCNPGTVAKSKDSLLAHLRALDTALVTRTYLVGERVSLADLATCLTLLPAFKHLLDTDARSKLQHLTRWFNTIIHQDHVLQAGLNKVPGNLIFFPTPIFINLDFSSPFPPAHFHPNSLNILGKMILPHFSLFSTFYSSQHP